MSQQAPEKGSSHSVEILADLFSLAADEITDNRTQQETMLTITYLTEHNLLISSPSRPSIEHLYGLFYSPYDLDRAFTRFLRKLTGAKTDNIRNEILARCLEEPDQRYIDQNYDVRNLAVATSLPGLWINLTRYDDRYQIAQIWSLTATPKPPHPVQF
jgi:hypothetical protein